MLWNFLKTHQKIGFGTFLLVSVFVSFFLSFLDTHNSFALSQTVTFNTSSFSRNQQVTLSDLGFDGSFSIHSFDFAIDYGLGGRATCSSNIRLDSNGALFPLKTNQLNTLIESGGVIHSYYTSPLVYSGGTYLYFISSSSSCSIGDYNVSLTLYDYILDFNSSAPSGSLSITENGTYDVTQYAEAVVNVPPEIIQGDYHDDLVNIYHAIITCAGVCLVLYFFYGIYRMIIKSSRGGN